MTSSIKLGVSAFVVVLILLQIESSAAARVLTSSNNTAVLWDRTTIILYNDIDAELTVHCKSKNDDLGIQVLQKGQSWQFSFDPNLFGSTLFYGSFQWDGQLRYFDVYKQGRDFRYKQIRWRVTTTGLCYIIHGDEYCHPWNS